MSHPCDTSSFLHYFKSLFSDCAVSANLPFNLLSHYRPCSKPAMFFSYLFTFRRAKWNDFMIGNRLCLQQTQSPDFEQRGFRSSPNLGLVVSLYARHFYKLPFNSSAVLAPLLRSNATMSSSSCIIAISKAV